MSASTNPPGREIIAAAINTSLLAGLADSVANDGMQALLKVLKERDIPGGLGDSRPIRDAFRAVVLQNIMAHATTLITKTK